MEEVRLILSKSQEVEYYNIEDTNNTDYTESMLCDEKSDDNICDITIPENLGFDADFFPQENINPSKKDISN